VRDSIKSFPSGHASISVFTAIFLIVSAANTSPYFVCGIHISDVVFPTTAHAWSADEKSVAVPEAVAAVRLHHLGTFVRPL
jgi:hypothetical protein